MEGTGQPFFSIIIPTFNAEKHLQRSIASITSQTFREFECLIMDGASTDETLVIAKKFVAKDSRFKLFSETDAGVYEAMNQGIKKSQGRYIYFLGADDYLIDPSVLEDVYKTLSSKEIQVLYGDVQSPELGDQYDGKFSNQKIAKKNICHQSIFCARSVYDKVGMFDLKYKIQADWEHNWRWFFDAEITCKYYNRIIAYYEQDGLSSGKKDLEFRRDFAKKFIANSSPSLKFFQALSILAKTFFQKVF